MEKAGSCTFKIIVLYLGGYGTSCIGEGVYNMNNVEVINASLYSSTCILHHACTMSEKTVLAGTS